LINLWSFHLSPMEVRRPSLVKTAIFHLMEVASSG